MNYYDRSSIIHSGLQVPLVPYLGATGNHNDCPHCHGITYHRIVTRTCSTRGRTGYKLQCMTGLVRRHTAVATEEGFESLGGVVDLAGMSAKTRIPYCQKSEG